MNGFHVGLLLHRIDTLIGLNFIIILRLVLVISLLTIIIYYLIFIITMYFVFFTIVMILLLMLVLNGSLEMLRKKFGCSYHFHVGHHISQGLVYFVILICDTLLLCFLLVRQRLGHEHL